MSCQSEKKSEKRLGDHTKNSSTVNLDTSTNLVFSSRLREEVKNDYHARNHYQLGISIKDYWRGDYFMFPLVNLTPEKRESYHLEMLCNKSTMLYWETSAQTEKFGWYSRLVFAYIYKCWFQFHRSEPNTHFGKYFAHPFRITRDGPQTIPDILMAHAHLCDDIASQLVLKKGINGVTHPIGRSEWQHYHLLPLCRAVITLLDKDSLSPPEFDEDDHLLLDNEVKRATVVLVLTGDQRGLSDAVNFDAITSESLPLSRNDIDKIDGANIIRVSMKTAVHFITGLQQREEKALSNASQGGVNITLRSDKAAVPIALDDNSDSDYVLVEKPPKNKWNWSVIENTTAMKRDGILTAFKDADEFADAVFDNPSKDDWKLREIKTATNLIRFSKDDRCFPDNIYEHWPHNWI